MEDEFYELVNRQLDETEEKLSALDKILKAFEQKEENGKQVKEEEVKKGKAYKLITRTK